MRVSEGQLCEIAVKHRRERFAMSFAYTMALCSNK